MDPLRIDLGEFSERYAGSSVQVRATLSFKNRQIVDNARLPRMLRGPDGRVSEAQVDLLEFGLTLLERSVISWEGVNDAQGTPLPATRAGFEHDDFDGDLGDWIVARIERLHQERGSAEQRKAAPAPSKES